jgi:16S rRNA (adenine1518-N6/adenine1519-N6)-dimethyltransferase
VSGLPDAKRRLGQHFLVDQNLLGVIERLAGLGPDDVVLEIGPGAGVLTTFLAERVSFVHAVELDRTLQARLDEALRGHANVRVTYGDAVRLDLAALEPAPTKLVANLPYNVATPIVVESLDGLPTVGAWCVMVQLEVARRFFAKPGTGDYGAVSVLMQLATRRTGFHAVSRTVFRPQPNVDSALVAFERIERPSGWPELKRVVEASFAHRRKTLPNSLALAGVASREEAAAALVSIDHDPSTRAERLAPPEFVRLRDALAGRS